MEVIFQPATPSKATYVIKWSETRDIVKERNKQLKYLCPLDHELLLTATNSTNTLAEITV
jgi:hypothetical protein